MASLPWNAVICCVQRAVLNYPFHILVGFVLLHLLRNKFRPGLYNIPGPTLAAYTRLWRAWNVWKGQAHLTAIQLHQKHGNVVRIGPKHVSISDPAYIPIIYNLKETFRKTAFYPIQQITWKKKQASNIFSILDPVWHKVQKRKVGYAFSLPSILQSEEAINNCIELFMNQLDEFASKKTPCDLGAWLQYYAFDVIGEVAFAQRFGFLETGRDVDGTIEAIKAAVTYAAIVGQIPELHYLLFGNPLLIRMTPAMESWNQVIVFTLKAINNRASINGDGELLNADSAGRDILSKWVSVKASNPDKLTTKDLVSFLTGIVFAGSDTTAIALRATVYFLCRHPKAMEQAVEEIDKADQSGNLSNPVSYKESLKYLPYCQAVLKESLRLHGSIGLILERHVPPEGLKVGGHFLKGGTVIGINPWVTNMDATAFPEPDKFLPERWLQTSEEQLKQMDMIWEYNFGAGARKCTGKAITWLEMSKILPQLLRFYTIDLTHPEKEWKVSNHWFVQQYGLICNITKRLQH